MKHFLALPLALVAVSLLAHAQTSQKDHPPLVVGPVSLNCIDKPCSAATITGLSLIHI